MKSYLLRGADAREVLDGLGRLDLDVAAKAALFFADAAFDGGALARGVAERFPAAATCGCSGYGVVTNAGVDAGSLLVVAFGEDEVEAAAADAVENLSDLPDPRPVIDRMGDRLGVKLLDADPDRYAGLVLTDGASYGLDRLLDRLGDRSLIPFVGGTASDGLKFADCWVAVNGRAFRNASVLLTMRMKRAFLIGKTQSLEKLSGETYTPGRDPDEPLVFKTLNGRPAAEAYLEAAGVKEPPTPERLAEIATRRMLGLSTRGDLYAFAAYGLREGGALEMISAPRADWPLHLVGWTDIVADMRAAVARLTRELGQKPAFVVEFMCATRYQLLEREGRTAEYLACYGDIPVVGFATHGEAYYTAINATSTFLVVG